MDKCKLFLLFSLLVGSLMLPFSIQAASVVSENPSASSAKTLRSTARRGASAGSTISAPVITPDSGAMIHPGDEIKISCASSDAYIYFGCSTTGYANITKIDSNYAPDLDHIYINDKILYIASYAEKGGQYSDTVYAVFYAPDGVVFTPAAPAGKWTGLYGTTLTLTCDEGANLNGIYYGTTLDTTSAAMPDAIGTQYTSSFRLTETMKICAFARYKINSYPRRYGDTVCGVYQPRHIAPPVPNPEAGYVAKGKKLNLSCATDDAEIYYLISATKRETASLTLGEMSPYESASPYTFDATTPVYVYAVSLVPGFDTSAIIEAKYDVLATPFINSNDLTDGAIYCAFGASGLNSTLWLQNADPTKTCVWVFTLSNLQEGKTSEITYKEDYNRWGGVSGKRDTVDLRLTIGDMQPTYRHELSAQVKYEGEAEFIASFSVTIPRRAKQATGIVISDLLNDSIYCDGLDYSATIAADPNYKLVGEDFTNNYGEEEGEKLTYRWDILKSATADPYSPMGFTKSSYDPAEMYKYTSSIENEYEKAYWYVQPYTCESSSVYKNLAAKQQIHYVIRRNSFQSGAWQNNGLTDSILGVERIEYDAGSPDEPWQKTESDYICHYYSPEYNDKENSANKKRFSDNMYWNAQGSAGTTETGYIAFQATPYKPQTDPRYKFYQYEWDYDTAHLEMMVDMMNNKNIYKENGFGKDSARCLFRVKGHDENYKVEIGYRMYCAPCVERAKQQNRDTLYSKTFPRKAFGRVYDTIDQSVTFDPFVILGQSGTKLYYDPETQPKGIPLCGKTNYHFCADVKNQSGTIISNDDNIRGVVWYNVPIEGQYTNSPSCDGGLNATTKTLAESSGVTGKTYTVVMRPYNKCFENGGDTIEGENGKKILVFLRATPTPPQIIDTLELPENPVFQALNKSDLKSSLSSSFCYESGGGAGGAGGTDQESIKFCELWQSLLLCNNPGTTASLGYYGQSFYIVTPDNRIMPQRYGDGDLADGGIGMVFPKEMQGWFNYSLQPAPGHEAGVKSDTNMIHINVVQNNDYYTQLKGKQQIPFGFYAANECGPGDTGYIAVNIIDLLDVYTDVIHPDYPDRTEDDNIDICEGVRVDWTTKQKPLDLYKTTVKSMYRNTDPYSYVWQIPRTGVNPWSYVLDSTSPSVAVLTGSESDHVKLALKNRCGLGPYKKGPQVNVAPYVRVNLRVIDTTMASIHQPSKELKTPPTDEYLVHPCQTSMVVYAADVVENVDEYQWTFPNDWFVFNDVERGTASKIDQGMGNRVFTNNVKTNNAGTKETRVVVRVGSPGNLEIIGSKPQCNFTFDNVDGNADFRGHHRNEFYLLSRPYTQSPAPDTAQSWKTHFCVQEEHFLSVLPNLGQDSMTRSHTTFTWKMTDRYWNYHYNARGDSVFFSAKSDVQVPRNGDIKDTLVVYSHRDDLCQSSNRGDSLVYEFYIIDTLSLDPAGYFEDKRFAGDILNTSPCEGDTVEYRLLGNNTHLLGGTGEGIWYSWDSVGKEFSRNNEFLHPGTDSIVDSTGWRVLNEPGVYNRPLKMIVGRSPLRISAQGISGCGYSSPISVNITPIALVRDTAHWPVKPEILCAGERLTLRHDSIDHATHYEWHYPWGALSDTLPSGSSTRIRPMRTFSEITQFDTGYIYVVPMNVCGRGPVSERIHLASLMRHLARPDSVRVVADESVPASSGSFIGLGDTVSDTVCLRDERFYQVYFTDTAHPGITDWKFNWFILSADAKDSLAMLAGPTPDSSRAAFFKRGGRDKDHYIGVTVRHSKCRSESDTLTIRVFAPDTIAITNANMSLATYLNDELRSDKKIVLGPCGDVDAKWTFNKKALDSSANQYQFVWRRGDNTALERNVDASNMLDGSTFKWLNKKTESDWSTSFYDNDTLHFSIKQNDSLFIAVNVKNRCGTSHLPEVMVKSRNVISGKPTLSVTENPDFCDLEKLVVEASFDPDATDYVWYFPWGKGKDTVNNRVYTFEEDTLQAGFIYVQPFNGCGNGPSSDSIEVKAVKRIPPHPLPANFGSSYAGGTSVTDSICMRMPVGLKVNLPGGNGVDTVDIVWNKLAGSGTFNPVMSGTRVTDSCDLSQSDVKAEAFRLSVYSRVKGCNRYSDSLIVSLFPMDTLVFVSISEDEEQVLGTFDVLFQNLIVDADAHTPVSAKPCQGSSQNYGIVSDFHWSIDPDSVSWFSWRKSGADLRDTLDGDNFLAGTDWLYNGSPIPAAKTPLSALPIEVGEDIVDLYIHVANVCGWSRSPAFRLTPNYLPQGKPQITQQSVAICLGGEAEFTAAKPRYADTLYWDSPWKRDTNDLSKRTPLFRVEQVGPETGLVIAKAANQCGDGESDTLEITSIMQKPRRPQPTWYSGSDGYAWNGDTVTEYICLHGTTSLSVRRDETDGADLRIQWSDIKGNVTMQSGISDTIRIVEPVVSLANDDGLLAVYGSYPLCGGAGDTLYIRLRYVDTVSSSGLGNIVYRSHEILEESHPEPCPSSEILFTVETPAAEASFVWMLPQDWHFKRAGDPNTLPDEYSFRAPGDTLADTVVVVVGTLSGQVSLRLRTPETVLGCRYFSVPISTVDFYPREQLQTAGFGGDFRETPCVEDVITYNAEATPGAKVIRWQVPGDWKILFPEGISDNEHEGDTVWKTGTGSIRVNVGSKSGYIRFQAVDSCGPNAILGTVTERAVRVIDTARLAVMGDHHSCIDSTLDLTVFADGDFADPQKYTLEIVGPGKDDVDIVFPETLLSGVADSSKLQVTAHGFDTAYLKLTPHNIYASCPDRTKALQFFIKADTVPEIKGKILGPDVVCEDNIYTYTFRLDPSNDYLAGKVECNWIVPEDSWEVVDMPDDTTVVLHFIRIPEKEDGSALRHTDTLLCAPRGICGTALPLPFEVALRPADEFSDSLIVENLSPCVETEIAVGLRDSLLYKPYPDSIKFVWNLPSGWIRLDGDSLPYTAYKVEYDTAPAVVSVRKQVKGSCGLSQALKATIRVRDRAETLAADTSFMNRPCYEREIFSLSLAPAKGDVDSVIWTVRPKDSTTANFVTSLYTRPGANYRNDSIVLYNPNRYKDTVRLIARTVNECGYRDSIYLIVPISTLAPFPSAPAPTRLCAFDTGYVSVKLPLEHLEQGVSYRWAAEDSSARILETFVQGDTICVMRYAHLRDSADLRFKFVAKNDCLADTTDIAISPYFFALSVVAGPDTVGYGGSSCLEVDSLITPDGKQVSDFTYTWTPENRLQAENAAAPDRHTRELVLPVETFRVDARMKVDSANAALPVYRRDGLCTAFDTVRIVVDSQFALMKMEDDTVCIDIPYLLSPTPRYPRDSVYNQWWLISATDTVLVAENVDTLLQVMTEAGENRYMLVGCDSAFIYDRDLPDSLILTASYSDTVYFTVSAYELNVRYSNVASDDIEIPVGAVVELIAQVSDGCGKYSYRWEPASMVALADTVVGFVRTQPVYKNETLSMFVTDSTSGCETELSVLIKTTKEEKVPNLFTPNGDGINDFFMRNVDVLIIFSRWGEELVRITDGSGWDGTYKGQRVRPGEYLYTAEFRQDDGSIKVLKGVVTVKID